MELRKILKEFIENLGMNISQFTFPSSVPGYRGYEWAYIYMPKQNIDPIIAIIIKDVTIVMWSYYGDSDRVSLHLGDPEFFNKLEEYISRIKLRCSV